MTQFYSTCGSYITQLPSAGHHKAITGSQFNTATGVVYAVQNTSTPQHGCSWL